MKVARTRFFNGPDPVWDQEFLLDDIPPDVLTLTLTINNKGKRSKDSEVAELTVEFSNLSNGDEVEEWYNLSGMTPVGEWGTIRLRTRYLHDLIMPEEEYSPLKGIRVLPQLQIGYNKDCFYSNRIVAGSSFGGCPCFSRLVSSRSSPTCYIVIEGFQVSCLTFNSFYLGRMFSDFFTLDTNEKKPIYFKPWMMQKSTKRKKRQRCLGLPPWLLLWWTIIWNLFARLFWRLPSAKPYTSWWKLNNLVKYFN